ncbi:MAG TPA: dihydropteroate synthase [Pirellulaceae bacterium]|nr:dihydropteroate synthase [Pirellulaceae bacterium]
MTTDNRPTSWKLRTRTLQFGRLPLLMGIVNVTPDSFSDGGQFLDRRAAVAQALRLVEEGAEILDIGGESTRPYSTPVNEAEELARVVPVISQIRQHLPEAVLSIDTSKATVAKAAIEMGVQIINDVTGLTGDPAMLEVARSSGAGVCAMHMQGTPQTMQDNPFYDDVVEDIYMYLCQRRDELLAAGIDRERLCLDPGIGFGKTHQHNLTLMAHCDRFHELGCPLLVGHSRKGFIGKLIDLSKPRPVVAVPAESPEMTSDRTYGTIGGALALARQGVQILRVHDVRAVREALLVFDACGGIDGQELRLS